MRNSEQILKDELSKIKPNHFIRIFYDVNKIEVLKIIRKIQKEAYVQGVEDLKNLTNGLDINYQYENLIESVNTNENAMFI
jgi:hypothetical protein